MSILPTRPKTVLLPSDPTPTTVEVLLEISEMLIGYTRVLNGLPEDSIWNKHYQTTVDRLEELDSLIEDGRLYEALDSLQLYSRDDGKFPDREQTMERVKELVYKLLEEELALINDGIKKKKEKEEGSAGDTAMKS